jgi:hypothetical protein
MSKRKTRDRTPDVGAERDAERSDSHGPFRVRLPGFVTEEEVGLGDVIKRSTSALGIRPCGGCHARAATLNRWVTFTGKRSG